MIRLYCVGIFFNKLIEFKKDKEADGELFMLGSSVLAAAKVLGLRYELAAAPSAASGHIQELSYTPNASDPTYPHKPKMLTAFPYGTPLKLKQVGRPQGEVSHIFQYSVTNKKVADPVLQNLSDSPQFANNGFADHSEIRVRLLSIFSSIPVPAGI